MKKAVLCFGSNCGEREQTLLKALETIRATVGKPTASSMYETPAVASVSSPAYARHPYINMVVKVDTEMTESILEHTLKKAEADAGRDEECRRLGLVPLDIDIVVYDGKIVRPRDYAQSFFQIGYSQIGRIDPS